MQSELIVYYRQGCPFAGKLRLKLKLARLPHRAIRFGEDSDADEAVLIVGDGNEISPTVRIGEQYLANPTLHQIRQAVAKR